MLLGVFAAGVAAALLWWYLSWIEIDDGLESLLGLPLFAAASALTALAATVVWRVGASYMLQVGAGAWGAAMVAVVLALFASVRRGGADAGAAVLSFAVFALMLAGLAFGAVMVGYAIGTVIAGVLERRR